MIALPLALWLGLQAASAGQNVTGAVVNATTGAPLANTPVSLVVLQGNMSKQSTTTTDASGYYRFSASGAGPFMVEADWQGVPYFAQVAKGQSETNVQVYNVVHDAKLLQVDAEIMVLQPDQGQLAIVNEYRVENGAQPLRTLAPPAGQRGLFRFRVPAGAQVDMVRVVGPGEMPLAREPEPTAEHDVYAVDSPIRPGETKIQISYRVPYAGLKAALSETPVIRPAHFEVYVPQPMTFAGDGFSQVGQQDGYKVFGIATGLVQPTESFSVSGDAPLPTAAASSDTSGASAPAAAPPAPSSDASAAPADAAAVPAGAVPEPTFIERNKWTVVALLALAAAAGFGAMLAKSEPTPATPAGSPPAPSLPAAPALDSELAKLKDDLFLLEVRRHTGDLADADYARLRAELDTRLSRLRTS